MKRFYICFLVALLIWITPALADWKYYGQVRFQGDDVGGAPDGLVYAYSEADGWHYVGEMANGRFDGYGVYFKETDEHPVFYAGEWTAHQYNGHGVLYNSSGLRFSGEFDMGRLNGAGSYTTKDGEFDVIWKDHSVAQTLSHNPDAPLPVVIYESNEKGAKLFAEVKNEQLDGVVAYISGDGDVQIAGYIEGELARGLLSGSITGEVLPDIPTAPPVLTPTPSPTPMTITTPKPAPPTPSPSPTPLVCARCDGKGKISCDKCFGTKEVRCSGCLGDGYNYEWQNGERVRANCMSCGGDGKVECKNCDLIGKIQCPYCHGSGTL